MQHYHPVGVASRGGFKLVFSKLLHKVTTLIADHIKQVWNSLYCNNVSICANDTIIIMTVKNYHFSL